MNRYYGGVNAASQLSLYKVINSSRGAHAKIDSLKQADVHVYCNSPSGRGERPFSDSSYTAGHSHVQFWVSSFSGGGLGAGPVGITPLPVGLVLEVRHVRDYPTLKWTAAYSEDISHFEIQKSYDNNSFVSIGKVWPTSVTLRTYSFPDQTVMAPGRSGTYYRVVAALKNGNVEYSKSVYLSHTATRHTEYRVYPNPVREKLNIDFVSNIEGLVTIELFDVQGRSVITKAYDKVGSIELDVRLIPSGSYILKISDDISFGYHYITVE